MTSYPDNLLYYVKKMQGYSRNNVKVLPLTTTKAKFGDTITFRLPTNALIDLSSWVLHGDLNVVGKSINAPVRFGRDSASMIRSMQVQIGGQTIQNLDHYNVVWQALKQLTQSEAASSCNKYLEWDQDFLPANRGNFKDGAHNHDQTTAEGVGVLAPGGRRGYHTGVNHQKTSDDRSNTAPFICKNWLGFLASSPSILDTSLTGEIVISLTLETDPANFAHGASQGTQDGSKVDTSKFGGDGAGTKPEFDASNSFVENLFSTLDIINIADGVYEMVARQALDSGMLIEVPVPNYYTFMDSSPGFTFTTRFSIGCQSLDAAMCLLRRSDFTGDAGLNYKQGTPGGANTLTNWDDDLKNVYRQTYVGAYHSSTAGRTAEEAFKKDAAFDDKVVFGLPYYAIQKGLRFNGLPSQEARNDGWQWEINGAFVPAHRVNRQDTLYYQKHAFGIQGADHGCLTGGKSGIRPSNRSSVFDRNDMLVLDRHYIPVVRFSHGASDKRMLSGIDARSNPVQLAFNSRHSLTFTGPTSGAQSGQYDKDVSVRVMVVALCTSTLMIGAGQQLSFAA